MTSLLHTRPDQDGFETRLQTSQLDRIARSPLAARRGRTGREPRRAARGLPPAPETAGPPPAQHVTTPGEVPARPPKTVTAMYVKTTKKVNKTGTVRYLHLAHNEWDPVTGRSVPKVLFTFGREDQLDRPAIRRLIRSLSKILGDDDSEPPGPADRLRPPPGDLQRLDQLWRSFGIDRIVTGQVARSGAGPDRRTAERLVFALVASRALAPSAKLADTQWIRREVRHDGLGATDEQQCLRVLDRLRSAQDELERRIVERVTDSSRLDTSRLILHTATQYFETDGRNLPGLPPPPLTRVGPLAAPDPADTAHWSDSAPGLLHSAVHIAITPEGVPLRCWPSTARYDGSPPHDGPLRSFPGSGTKLVHVVERGSLVQDRPLAEPDHVRITRVLPRPGAWEVRSALTRQGRYHHLDSTIRIKEIRIGASGRAVICHDTALAEEQGRTRRRVLADLEETIAATDGLCVADRSAVRSDLMGRPDVYGFLRQTTTGRLRVDRARVRAEERFDGKYLLHCGDDSLSARDIALAHLHLRDTDRRWRDLRQVVDLRPADTDTGSAARAHLFLCWLALLLTRLADT